MSNFLGHYNWKQVNLQLVSFAGGLALASVAVIGGSEILRDRGSSNERGSLSAPQAERLSPQFDTAAADSPLNFVYVVGSQSEAETLERAFATEALVDSGVSERDVMVIDSPQEEAALFLASGELAQVDDGGVTLVDLRTPSAPAFNASEENHGAFPLVQEMSHRQVGPAPPSQTSGIYSAEVIYPTDFGSQGNAHQLAQAEKGQFGTAADAAYASEVLGELSSVPRMFGTMVDGVYAIEGAILVR